MIADHIRKLAEEDHIPVLGFGPASEMAGELVEGNWARAVPVYGCLPWA